MRYLLFVSALLFPADILAQPQWSPARTIGDRFQSAMVYDAARERVVLFGGRESGLGDPPDTWEWAGNAWTLHSTPGEQMPFLNHAMAYDTARQRIVLFGGTEFGRTGTWEWDGERWTQRVGTPAPRPRQGHCMAYDAARRRTVLYGGSTEPGRDYLDDTWEWDGTTWSLRATGVPFRREGATMAYDARRQRVVMFGGLNFPYGWTEETWEWDGIAWTRRYPPTVPRARYDAAMAEDGAGGILLHGGIDGYRTVFGDAWRYDGVNWQLVQAATPVGPRYGHSMAFDGRTGRIVLTGGRDATHQGLADTWEYTAGGFVQRYAAGTPAFRDGSVMTFDRARGSILLFGGALNTFPRVVTGDTWEWSDNRWLRRAVTGPPARYDHALAFDSTRQRTVLFGGRLTPFSLVNDTWEWDGNAWTILNPSTAPSPRVEHGLVFDAGRQRTLLFGGHDGTQNLGDTWQWDGTTWSQLNPTRSPSPRYAPSMTYDPVRQRVVLVGGHDGPLSWLGDTWEWDGSTWTAVAANPPAGPPANPAGRAGGLAYDEARQRLVFVSGTTAEWNGTGWIDTMTRNLPSVDALAYDAVRGHVVSIGVGTWIYSGLPPASVARFGTGCGGSVLVPRLTSPLPYLGNAGFTLDLAQARPTSPAAVAIATATQSLPIGAGCVVYLAGSLITIPTASNAAGVARVAIPLPVDSALSRTDLHTQGVVLDPSAPLGIALSARWTIRVGE